MIKTHKTSWILLLAMMSLPVFVFFSCSDDDTELEPTYDLILEVYPAEAGIVTGGGE